jgi:hypothetical protein
MSYQFIHVETYSKSPSTKAKPDNKKFEKKSLKTSDVQNSSTRTTHNTPDSAGSGHGAPKKPRASVQEVINEAIREVGYCPHVDNPLPPTFLMGDINDLKNIPLQIELNIEAHCIKTKTRRPRSDSHTLLAGTASYPRGMMEEDPDRYQKWKQATLDYLKTKYGKNLKVVLEHLDEDHPHIHFYAIGQGLETNAKLLHDGHREALALHKPMTQDYNRVFKETMVSYQSDYYEKVTHGIGLLRDGPRRKRTDKATHEAAKRSANERYALDCKSVDRALEVDLRAAQLDQELQNVPMMVDAKVAEKVSAKVKALESNYADKEAHLGNQHLKKRDGLEAKELALNEREAQLKDEAKRLAKPMAKTMATRMANTQILELFESELEPIPSAPTGIFSGAKWKETYDHMKHLVATLQKKLAVSDRAVTFARESYEVRGKEALKSVERVKSLTDQVESLLKNDAEQATLMNQLRSWMPVQVEAVMAAIDYAQASNAERRKMDIKKHLPVLQELNKDYADTMMKDLHI